MLRRVAPVLMALLGMGGAAAWAPQVSPGQEPVLHRLWHMPLAGRGGPAVDDTTAYFLTKDHEVLAVEIETGHTRWRRQTHETGDALSGAAVLVDGASVVVGDYNILAFDRRTGSLRWRFVPADGYGPGVYLGDIADGAALAGSPSGRVYAVEVESGALRWSAAVATDGRTTVYSPAARGSYVAAGYTEFRAPNRGGVVLLSIESGRILWKQAFSEPSDALLNTNWAGGPVFLDDEVVVASGDGNIHAFAIESGEVRWTIPKVTGRLAIPIPADRDFRPLAAADGVLISGSLTGQIIGYDTATRAERWRYFARDMGSSAFRIAAVEDEVYVPFANGRLVALGALDGGERWRMGDWTSGFLWPPAVAGEAVVLSGSGDGLSAVRWQP